MVKKSITKRWLFNSIGVISIILVVAILAFSFSIQSYFYSSSKQYISSRMTMISSLLTRYSSDANLNFSSEIRNLVENFSEKDKMEFMVINSRGKIAITSSGFTPNSDIDMKDYELALKSPKGQGYYVGRLDNGEKIMAVCIMISDLNSGYDAVRLVVSMEQIDRQIWTYIFGVSIVCGVFFILILFSALYFIKSK